MDEEAVKMGHQISDPMIWEYEYEGTTFAIIEDGREWPAAYEKRKGIAIHTMREVAIALVAELAENGYNDRYCDAVLAYNHARNGRYAEAMEVLAWASA